MGTKHRDMGKPDGTDGGTEGGQTALHRIGYWTDTDPASTYGTGEGGVEAGQTWVEHASGDPDTIVNVWIRNEANGAWVNLLAAPTRPDTKTVSAATYTLVLGDAETVIDFTNGSAVVVTVPSNASVAFDVGTQIILSQGSTGAVAIQGASGVTVRAEGGKDTTVGQHAVAGLIKVATDEWLLFGNLEAAS